MACAPCALAQPRHAELARPVEPAEVAAAATGPEMAAEIKPEPYDPDWKGGYFCPCHKSRFDMAGRVFQGVPAPTNLVVPPHYYENDTTIIVGLDPQGGA